MDEMSCLQVVLNLMNVEQDDGRIRMVLNLMNEGQDEWVCANKKWVLNWRNEEQDERESVMTWWMKIFNQRHACTHHPTSMPHKISYGLDLEVKYTKLDW
jgi:hypothetical protein